MSLRETLDDAADLALDGRRVDPTAVLAKAAVRDAPAARLRRRAPWLLGVAAAAAALALTAALLPWPAFGRVAPATPPPLGPTGLPTRLDAPPPWTPLVTEQPIEAASVVFGGWVVHGVAGTGAGLFVLSADGREYRRLPWSGDATAAPPALSADGRWVAWLEGAAGGLEIEPVVHVLRLRDGHRQDLVLTGMPSGSEFTAGGLAFLPGADGGEPAGLVLSGTALDPETGSEQGRTWRADLPSGAVRLVCDCTEVFGQAADGTVYRAELYRRIEGLADLPVLPGASREGMTSEPRLIAVSPDGTAWARGDGDHVLQVGRASGQASISVDVPRLSVPEVLGWGPRGVLAMVQVPSESTRLDGEQFPVTLNLVWLDPSSGTSTVVAPLVTSNVTSSPVVAAGLVAAGTQVPTARPAEVPWWSGDHRAYLAGRAFVVLVGLLGVAGILGLPWILRRLRRRDGTVLTDANGVAGNQGRLW